MSDAPRVSVVIPLYNHVSSVGVTLDSILSQTVRPHEVIVVDDGSTDDPALTLAPYVDAGHIQLLHQENAGVSAARNLGIEAATGDY
ncbi:MAG: glycosyltransferase, partial [Candidatus Hydrogenedentota bacterium]